MAKKKNKELKNNLTQAIQNSDNPWEMQQNIQQHLQSVGLNYTKPLKHEANASKSMNMPDYDVSKLMDKLGDKMPPGVKQMLDQFITLIPGPGSLDNPNFKKQMKKKMKNMNSIFKSPYE